MNLSEVLKSRRLGDPDLPPRPDLWKDPFLSGERLARTLTQRLSDGYAVSSNQSTFVSKVDWFLFTVEYTENVDHPSDVQQDPHLTVTVHKHSIEIMLTSDKRGPRRRDVLEDLPTTGLTIENVANKILRWVDQKMPRHLAKGPLTK